MLSEISIIPKLTTSERLRIQGLESLSSCEFINFLVLLDYIIAPKQFKTSIIDKVLVNEVNLLLILKRLNLFVDDIQRKYKFITNIFPYNSYDYEAMLTMYLYSI